MYGLRYNDLIAPMVKGMQELKEIIEKQQSVIERQQKAIELLKKK